MDHPRSDAALSFPAEPDLPEHDFDARLERDLLLLLSKLEQGRSYLAEPATRRQPALALQAALAILDEAARFTEKRRAEEPDPQVDAVLASARELASSIHALLKEFNPRAMQSVLSFFGRRPPDGAQHRSTLQRAMRELPPVLEGFFAVSERRFRTTAAARDWVGVYRIFLDDLSFAIDAF
jgi:hypothetical protein